LFLLPPLEPSGTMVWWAADGVENLTGYLSVRVRNPAIHAAIVNPTLISVHALQ